MQAPDFQLKVIADISCDIAPDSSVPSTLRASTIAEPVYGFDPVSGLETRAFHAGSVDMMAIDNLPSELPRDASAFFGKQLIDNILPELLHVGDSAIIHRGTIAADGNLTEPFAYLFDYVNETASIHSM
jgi:hypothetical protein